MFRQSFRLFMIVGLGWLTVPSCANEDNVLLRVADNATNQFIRSDEDMKKWYEAYYNAISDFYQAKPELICPDPEKLKDMLEDLEDQIKKIRDCRSEKEEQIIVLQNITAAMNHNSTIVQQLEDTMGNLTLNARVEDGQLKNQEDEILKLKKEVNNFVCNCEYEEWSDDWSLCSRPCVPDNEDPINYPVKNRTRGVKWDARNNGTECVDTERIDITNCTVCELDTCEVNYCPVDCLWGEWGEWPPCPDECGIQEITRYRTMYEHRNGGQPCEGSGQESKLCNAWVDAKSDLLTCKAKFEEMELINQTQSQEFSKQADKIIEMETEIADLQQQLNNTEPDRWIPDVILVVGGLTGIYTRSSEIIPASKEVGCSLPRLPRQIPGRPATKVNSLVTHIDTDGEKILLTCEQGSKPFPSKCFKWDKTNGQTKWVEYNRQPDLLGANNGRSFITTPKGVFAFGDGGIAFLPKGKKDWTEGPKFNNSEIKLKYSCPVLISDSEILLLGAVFSKKVWKFNIHEYGNSRFTPMPQLQYTNPRACGLHRPSNDAEPYILCVGTMGCEKYSLEGSTQSVGKLINAGMNPKVVSLGEKTYAVGTGMGEKVEQWNGVSWEMAPDAFQVTVERYEAGVMAVPRDFVC